MLDIIEHGEITEVRLAHKPVNALGPGLVRDLDTALNDAVASADAVVLSGMPGIFSAGLDVVELLPLRRNDIRAFWQAFFTLLDTIANSPIPVAAAITGHSPAGGALVGLMTDYRVMCRGKYRIGLNETRVGLVIAPLLQDSLAWLVGPRTAEKMIVSGALIGPEAALDAGLVDALEDDPEATVQHAIGWCRELLALPRRAMLGNRTIARTRYREAFAQRRDTGVETMTQVWFSDETQFELHELVAKLKDRG